MFYVRQNSTPTEFGLKQTSRNLQLAAGSLKKDLAKIAVSNTHTRNRMTMMI